MQSPKCGQWGSRRVGVFRGPAPRVSCRPSSPIGTAIRPPALCPTNSTTPTRRIPFSGRLRTTYLQLEGPAVVVCSACSSSAKVFGSGRRMFAAGLIDAAVVGGVDSLCLTTLYGFHSLQLTLTRPCRPFDTARDGISIGEAAAFALLERSAARPRCERGDAAGLRRVQRRLPHVSAAPRRTWVRAPPCRQPSTCRAQTERHRLHQSSWHRHAK